MVSASQDGNAGQATSTPTGAGSATPSASPPRSTTSPTTTRSSHRGQADRSCVPCHRRKVRCDKRNPCTACQRGHIACSYPSSAKQPRRARKTTIADVASRIKDLEKSITATATATTPHEPAPAQASQTSTFGEVTLPTGRPTDAGCQPGSVSEAAENNTSEHVLLRNGSSSQYFNEYLISRVLEEDQDKSSLLSTPQSHRATTATDPPFELMGVLSNPATFDQGASSGCVTKWSATQLWEIFVRNVDPAVKVLHLPTCEAMVFQAIDQPESVARDVMALVYAVYFGAVVSLEDHQVQPILGMSRSAALLAMKTQLHHNIALADPLETPTVTVIQALAIYLSTVRNRNHGRAVWTIYGLAIRIAQSMGMHRDGAKLGLSPMDAEVRRRIWWHFILRDTRAAEDHGISAPSGIPQFDTALPLNIEDHELTPDMTQLPPQRTGWTSMSLPLTSMAVAQALQAMSQIAGTSASIESKETQRQKIMQQAKDRTEAMLVHCNPIIPHQRMTVVMSRYILQKIDFITRRQIERMGESPEKRIRAKERDLLEACECLEQNMSAWQDELVRQFRWTMASYPQSHLLLYVFWHLCVSPESRYSERAWAVANTTMEMEREKIWDSSAAKLPFKFVVLQRLKRKAELIRESLANRGSQAGRVQEPNGGPSFEVDTDVMEAHTQGTTEWTDILQGIPDWGRLIEDFNMDANDFSTYIG